MAKRRKRKYITGTHVSNKSTLPINYRSGWEQSVCLFLDMSDNVEKYEYETIIIPYLANIKTGKIRNYYVDFLIYYKDGKKVLVEVKREDRIKQLKTAKKLKAGQEYAILNQMEWQIWTEKKITEIRKLLPPIVKVPQKLGVKKIVKKSKKKTLKKSKKQQNK